MQKYGETFFVGGILPPIFLLRRFMFVLYYPLLNKYLHDGDKYISFETEYNALNFHNAFVQYCMNRMMNEDIFQAGNVMHLLSSYLIEDIGTPQNSISWHECSNIERKKRTQK